MSLAVVLSRRESGGSAGGRRAERSKHGES
jgi:hypothetical protein